MVPLSDEQKKEIEDHIQQTLKKYASDYTDDEEKQPNPRNFVQVERQYPEQQLIYVFAGLEAEGHKVYVFDKKYKDVLLPFLNDQEKWGIGVAYVFDRCIPTVHSFFSEHITIQCMNGDEIYSFIELC